MENNVETSEETKPTMEHTVALIKVQQKALDNLVRLQLRDSLLRLTKDGVNLAEKKNIMNSIERAVLFPFDFSLDIVKARLEQSGKHAKWENALAAYLTKLLDNTMLLRADNMSKGLDIDSETIKQELQGDTNE